jgi:hypothetical protein
MSNIKKEALQRRTCLAALIAVGIFGTGGARAHQARLLSDRSQSASAPHTTRDPAKPSNQIQRVAALSELQAQDVDGVAQARFFDIYGGEKLSLDGGSSSRSISFGPIPVEGPPNDGFPGAEPTPKGRLQRRVCGTEATIVGRVSASRVYSNSKQTWLYTRYEIEPKASVRPSTLPRMPIVSIASGMVSVNGVLIKTISLPLLEPDRIYAITARRIPGSTAFTPVFGEPINLGTELKGQTLQRVDELIEAAASCKQGGTE